MIGNPADSIPPTYPPKAESNREANRALVTVSFAVLLASSTWLSGTAAVPWLRAEWNLDETLSAWLTTSVQLGFITGTFLYAFLNLADRFNPRRVFFASALLSSLFNGAFALFAEGLSTAIAFRLLTGIALAGIYPVGMKIIAMWFRSGLGWRLGVLVGALTMGTALPYLIQAIGGSLNWRLLVAAASGLAILGGGLLLFGVGDGPYLKERARFDGRMLFKVFQSRPFRYTAFGYFGHMWELYAFWSLIGFYVSAKFSNGNPKISFPLLSFFAVAAGALGCMAGGWISRWVGERKVALASLVISGSICALSGFAFDLPHHVLTLVIIIWGVFVVSDSPQFSALAAKNCPAAYTGTALTVQNGIGFAITVISIQLLPLVAGIVGWRWAFVFLAAGPVVGSYFMMRLDE